MEREGEEREAAQGNKEGTGILRKIRLAGV